MDKALKEKATTAALDWLVENCDADLCGHCAYYVPPKEDEDFTPCKGWDGEGAPDCKTCREGLLEHFAQELKNG